MFSDKELLLSKVTYSAIYCNTTGFTKNIDSFTTTELSKLFSVLNALFDMTVKAFA